MRGVMRGSRGPTDWEGGAEEDGERRADRKGASAVLSWAWKERESCGGQVQGIGGCGTTESCLPSERLQVQVLGSIYLVILRNETVSSQRHSRTPQCQAPQLYPSTPSESGIRDCLCFPAPGHTLVSAITLDGSPLVVNIILPSSRG